MRRIALILMVLAGDLYAQDWRRLKDVEIDAALSARVIDYDGAWQEFLASGRTLYNAGQDSWGYWETREGQYCSQWPPAGGWACYDVLQNGSAIRFVGQSGEITVGTLRSP